MEEEFNINNPDPKAVAAIDTLLENAESGHERITAYYRHRGLTITPPEDTLGYIAKSTYYGEDGSKRKLPVMVAVFESPDGDPVGALRTYLDTDSDGKANVTPSKKFTKAIYPGALKGAAIRLRNPENGSIGITEGVETAEAVFEATGMACWACGSAGGIKNFIPPAEIDHVTIWADNDTSIVGQQAAVALAQKLFDAGYSVRAIFPKDADIDWLDVLVAHGKDAILNAMTDVPFCDPNAPETQSPEVLYSELSLTVSPTAEADPVEILNKTHFITPAGGKICIATETWNPVSERQEIVLGSKSDLLLKYNNWPTGKKRTAANEFLESPYRREYKGLVFAPGKDVKGYYNLFRGFNATPINGDCSLFWEHLLFIVCLGNMNIYLYIRKWLAHLIQKPSELPGVAIVIVGLQGTGKSILVDIVGNLLGQHYLVLTRMEQLTGRFCGHLMDLLLVCANEALWGGDKAGQGALKAMITDPSISVEFKGKDIIQVANYKRFFITSNESCPVSMDMDDRRFLILQIGDAKKEDKAYFAALLNQMNTGGREALLYDLLHEDLNGFDVRSKPFSSYGFDIKLRSAEPIVKWWYERLHQGISVEITVAGQAGDEWRQLPSKDGLHENFMQFCSSHRLRGMSKAVFGKELRKLMPGCNVFETRPRIQISDDITVSSNSIQRCRYHILPTLEECRRAFEQYAKVGNEIWYDAYQPESETDDDV